MNLKFIFAVFLTAFTLTNVYAKMDSHKQPLLFKEKREAFIQAADRARDEGYEYCLKKQVKKAIAAYKIAKAYYEQAKAKSDVERMDDLINNPAAYDSDMEARMGIKS